MATKIKKRISAPETLLGMKVGEEIYIPTKTIKTVTLRACARRLERSGEAKFIVSEEGLRDKTFVKRLS